MNISSARDCDHYVKHKQGNKTYYELCGGSQMTTYGGMACAWDSGSLMDGGADVHGEAAEDYWICNPARHGIMSGGARALRE